MPKDFYDILGVSKSASSDEIKRAFRKKAHEHHPDKGSGNADKFKEVNEAYQVLSDDGKRKMYDQYGPGFEQAQRGGFGGSYGGQGNPFGGFDFNGFQNGGGVEFDLGDIFGDIFGGGRQQSRRNKGIDLEMGMSISFEEAVFGVEKEISLEKQDSCPTCKGTGAEDGAKVITCPKCHGQGQIHVQRKTIFGTIASAANCDRCSGTGKVPEKACHTCSGSGVKRMEKTLSVKIPAGIENGQRIRVPGEGEAGYRGSTAGDLFLAIKVLPHKEFVRDGLSLLKDLPVSFTQAALGAKLIVKTLDGDIELKVPAGTQNATILKVKDKGVPRLNDVKHRGDLLITIRVIVPSKLSKKEKQLLKELADERGESVEVDQGLWDSIKDSF